MSEESLLVLNLVQKFHLLQEERAHTYKLFEESHKIYLNTAANYHFSKFRQLINDVTQEFKRISVAMIGIEKQLRSVGHSKLADIVSQLQNDEKIKLVLSAKLQIAKQEAIDSQDLPQKWTEVTLIEDCLRDLTTLVNERLEAMRFEVEE